MGSISRIAVASYTGRHNSLLLRLKAHPLDFVPHGLPCSARAAQIVGRPHPPPSLGQVPLVDRRTRPGQVCRPPVYPRTVSRIACRSSSGSGRAAMAAAISSLFGVSPRKFRVDLASSLVGASWGASVSACVSGVLGMGPRGFGPCSNGIGFQWTRSGFSSIHRQAGSLSGMGPGHKDTRVLPWEGRTHWRRA